MTLELTYFPDKYEVNGRVFRTDTGKLYKNDGTFESPVWAEMGGVGVPAGTITMFAGLAASIPSGYLRCNGASVSVTTYDVLFAAIGYKWGNPGSGNFRLPNFESGNRFPRAANSDVQLSRIGGEDVHTLTEGEMPVHNHGITDPGHRHNHRLIQSSSNVPSSISGRASEADDQPTVGLNPDSTTGITVNQTGGGGAHENKPPFVSVYMIIKT